MGKLLLTIGLIGLCHAAYSATQHRSYIRLTEHDLDESTKRSGAFTDLPLDILAQTIVSLLLSCVGVISTSAKFRPIKITSEWENKTWDNISNRSSFYSFNHRGMYLFASELVKTTTTPLSATALNKYKATASSKSPSPPVADEEESTSSSMSNVSSNEEDHSAAEYSGDSDNQPQQ